MMYFELLKTELSQIVPYFGKCVDSHLISLIRPVDHLHHFTFPDLFMLDHLLFSSQSTLTICSSCPSEFGQLTVSIFGQLIVSNIGQLIVSESGQLIVSNIGQLIVSNIG